MTAPMFFAPDVSGDRIVLIGEEARHAVKSLRVRPGELIRVSDGLGAWAEAKVSEVGSELVAEVLDRGFDLPTRPELEVFQAVPKSGKLEVVVQKLTEIGAARIQLFYAGRSIPRWAEAKAEAQTERLRSVAFAAAKQARRTRLPEIGTPVGRSAVELPPASFVLHEEADRRLIPALPAAPPDRIGIVVGPEGGLSSEEVGSFERSGALAVSLGQLVLRTETAALVTASIVLARYGVVG